MRTLLAAIALASTLTSSAVAHSFCEVLKDGPALDGQIVRFQSRFLYDPYDLGGAFASDACKGTINDVTEPDKGDESVRQFDKELGSLLPKKFTIEVTGVFHWNKNWHPPMMLSAVVKPGPHGELEVTHVWSYREIRN